MIIELKDTVLREYRESDWERVHSYACLPEFTKFEAWGANTVEDTKSFISEMIKINKDDSRFQFEFAIEEKTTGMLIGGCGLRRETPTTRVGNLGYAVSPDFQGRGFATQATKGLLNLAFKKLKLLVVYTTCDAENIASFSIMKKCGMRQVGLPKGKRQFKNKVADELRFQFAS